MLEKTAHYMYFQWKKFKIMEETLWSFMLEKVITDIWLRNYWRKDSGGLLVKIKLKRSIILFGLNSKKKLIIWKKKGHDLHLASRDHKAKQRLSRLKMTQMKLWLKSYKLRSTIISKIMSFWGTRKLFITIWKLFTKDKIRKCSIICLWPFMWRDTMIKHGESLLNITTKIKSSMLVKVTVVDFGLWNLARIQIEEMV